MIQNSSLASESAQRPRTISDYLFPVTRVSLRRWFTWQVVVICLLALLCFAGVLVYWLMHREPQYWNKHQEFLQAHSYEQLKDASESFERHLLTTLTHISASQSSAPNGHANPAKPPAQPLTLISINIDEINAWMHVRLLGWLTNQKTSLPSGVKEPMLAVEDDRLVLAFKYESASYSQIASLVFDLSITPDGQGFVQLRKVRAGVLPVPLSSIGGLAESLGKAHSHDLMAALSEVCQGLRFDPVLTIDNNKVRILDIKINPGKIDLTVKAEEAKEVDQSSLDSTHDGRSCTRTIAMVADAGPE